MSDPPDGLYVQYGAGWSAPDGWHNFDASPTLRIERLPIVGKVIGRLAGNPEPFPAGVRHGDIVRGLPVPPGSVAGLYACHVLEHLALADMRTALANSHALLRPGGTFRLIVPDLLARARNYVAAAGDPGAAGRFLVASCLGEETGPRGLVGRLRRQFGNSAHLWMYDEPAMRAELAAAGFVAIRRARPGDAADRMFDRVERADRFVDGGIEEVALEARRAG